MNDYDDQNTTNSPDPAAEDGLPPFLTPLAAPTPIAVDEVGEPFALSEIDAADSEDTWFSGDPADASSVDDALAAVASLTLVSDREAEDLEDAPPLSTQKSGGRRASTSAFAAPPLTTLRRGSLASALPALLLIVIGTFWTFVTTTGEQLALTVIIAGAIGLVVVMLLLGWLGSGRWARGLLFIAATIAIAGVLMAAMLTTPGLDLPTAYPLLLLAPGMAFLITAVLGRPASPRLLLPGAICIAAAAVGIAFNAGLIPIDVTALVALVSPA